MARVMGMVSMKRVPLPFRVSTSIMPLWRVMFSFTTSRPTPLPEVTLTLSAVVNPGMKIRSRIS